MSSPQASRQISSGSTVASERESALKSQEQGMGCQVTTPQEMRKFLALPDEEKMAHTARKMAKLKKELMGKLEEEEEKEKKKNLKPIKSKRAFPEKAPGRHELKMAMMKQENISRDSKHELISMERQKAVLELSLMKKRSEISRLDKAIAKEERHLQHLETLIEKDNLSFEEFLRQNEQKSVEARTFYEQEAKSKLEKNVEIKKLTAEISTMKSEVAKFEEILVDYNRYKELLFKLSPPEWKEAQKAKALAAKDLSDKNLQGKQKSESEIKNGLESKVSRETRLSSSHSDTLITNSEQDRDSSEYEDEPALYFSNPQQLLDVMAELTEHNLSLIQNSTRLEETVEELRQSMETTRKKIEKEEEQLTHQINEMNHRIEEEQTRVNKLRQKIQVHALLSTGDQEEMLKAVGEKVSEVHRSCVDNRMTNLSTLEKLINIEKRLSLLLQGLENIPQETLETMKKIKDNERRSRQCEEKLKEQREKQEEKMRKYLARSLADSKKISGKKLMPRCLPVAQKVKVRHVDDAPAEDDLHAYLFTEDTE